MTSFLFGILPIYVDNSIPRVRSKCLLLLYTPVGTLVPTNRLQFFLPASYRSTRRQRASMDRYVRARGHRRMVRRRAVPPPLDSLPAKG